MGNNSNQVFGKVRADDKFKFVKFINSTEIDFLLAFKPPAGVPEHRDIGSRQDGKLKLICSQQVVGTFQVDGPGRPRLCRGNRYIQCFDQFL